MVSVLIPTYKSYNSLSLCLNALEQQTFKETFEVIVINNEEEHHIPEFILNYKNVRIIHEPIPGSYAARNKGISEAQGEIIAFTDADCIPDKDWLKNGVETLKKDPSLGIVAGNIHLIYRNNKKLNSVEIYEKYTAFNQKGYVANYGHCITANWFSYKKVLVEFGGFDNKLKSNGDSKLSGQITSKYKIVYDENAIIYHPARNTMKSLITKYRRLIGGRYDNGFLQNHKGLIKFVMKFLLGRVRFNLNLLRKGKLKDSLSVFYVHIFMFPQIIRESFKILKTNQTERM